VPGGVRREVMILPEVWKVELPNGEVQVSRSQVNFLSLCAFSMFDLTVIPFPSVCRCRLFLRGRCRFINLKDRL